MYAIKLNRNVNLEKLVVDRPEIWIVYDAEGRAWPVYDGFVYDDAGNAYPLEQVATNVAEEPADDREREGLGDAWLLTNRPLGRCHRLVESAVPGSLARIGEMQERIILEEHSEKGTV